MTEGGKVLNINVGVLGHVDSGKTSLAKALSTLHSTAAFDKSPQSKERGITLDLGFSAFGIPMPERLSSQVKGYSSLQFTLVDCPGHASLIRTIIGGAQIIDFMILVIDVTKGIQTQTAECLVIGEILMDSMLIILNKVDQIPAANRETKLKKMEANLRKALQSSKFKDCPMIPISANPKDGTDTNISALISHLDKTVQIPKRITSPNNDAPFWYAVDHCFSIKGKGTIATGTVLSGRVRSGDTVEIPVLGTQKKVKSMQMFHKAVEEARQGDRVGMNIVGLNAKELERGLVCSPGGLKRMRGAIVEVERVRYYKGSCRSNSGFHITVLHSTVLATAVFFEAPTLQPQQPQEKKGKGGLVRGGLVEEGKDFDFSLEYSYLAEYERGGGEKGKGKRRVYALLEFESPLVCVKGVTVIGSRMDADIHKNTCRLAFHGTIVHQLGESSVSSSSSSAPSGASSSAPSSSSGSSSVSSHSSLGWPKDLRVTIPKVREGRVDRINDENTLIATALFKKETDLAKFTGMKVQVKFGDKVFEGVIEGGFGKSGKVKVVVRGGGLGEIKKGGGVGEGVVEMHFKKLIRVKDHKMYQ